MPKKKKRKRNFNTSEYNRLKGKAMKKISKKHEIDRRLNKVDCALCGKWNSAHRNESGSNYCDDCLESGGGI